MKTGNIVWLSNKDGTKEKVRIVYYGTLNSNDKDYEQVFDNKHYKKVFDKFMTTAIYNRHKRLDRMTKESLERTDMLINHEHYCLIESVNNIGTYRTVNTKYLTSQMKQTIRNIKINVETITWSICFYVLLIITINILK